VDKFSFYKEVTCFYQSEFRLYLLNIYPFKMGQNLEHLDLLNLDPLKMGQNLEHLDLLNLDLPKMGQNY